LIFLQDIIFNFGFVILFYLLFFLRILDSELLSLRIGSEKNIEMDNVMLSQSVISDSVLNFVKLIDNRHLIVEIRSNLGKSKANGLIVF